MSDPILRAALFALAKEINTVSGHVTFSNWTRPPAAREAIVSLAENAVLNLFLSPRSVSDAAALCGSPEAELAIPIESLRQKGLLQTSEEWAAIRAKQPYANLPSLWTEAPPANFKPFESYEDAYANDYVPWNALPVAADTLSLAPLPGRHDMRILDIGCGSGHNLALMEQLGLRCSGIDISSTAITKIKQIAPNPDDFIAGSVTQLPWPDQSFDLVMDVGCLHCLKTEEVPFYVAELRRVMKPGGRFLCRSFKPREGKIVKVQPVKMERLGYSPDEIAALFAGTLPIELVKEGPVHGFYLATA